MIFRIFPKIVSSISILICFLSCNHKDDYSSIYWQDLNALNFKDSLTISEVKNVTFSLDKETGFFNKSILYFKKGDNQYLSFLNPLNNSIYIYDYRSTHLHKKIKLPIEGPNGVGVLSPGSAHYMETLDSIFVLNYFKKHIYILDKEGKVLKSFPLKGTENLVACPYSSAHPIIKVGSNLLLSSHSDTYYTKDTKSMSTILLNIKTGNIKTVFTFPTVYNQGAWLAPYKYINSALFNFKTFRFIVSFPVDPYIYSYDTSQVFIDKNYVGSKFVSKITPYSVDNSEAFVKKIASDKKDTYYNISHNYGAIWLTSDSQFYIRDLYIRPTEIQYKESLARPKNSLILFNTNFIKKGEVILPDSTYETSMSFITDEGLNLANYKKYKKDENKLTFTIFAISKK